MLSKIFSQKSELELTKHASKLVRDIADKLDLDVSVKLWDGSLIPLGPNVSSDLIISIASPAVLSSLVRRPSLDRAIQHYIYKDIDFIGGSLIEFGRALTGKGGSKRLKQLDKKALLKQLWPFLIAAAKNPSEGRGYQGAESGRRRRGGENKKFIQFHYDVGNEFYQLFLDQNMVYSCAYFKQWDNDLDQAQNDKLEMICRKLRLKQGDRLLDIGSGWGGLVCYAAKHFGVKAHGVTLSQEQLEFAQQKVKASGLEDQVSLELKDYADLTGTYDKIASIGMYEHIGLANIPIYLSTIGNLLEPGGLFLNHAISRRAKKNQKKLGYRPEQRAIMKYIFPGGELDDIGHTIREMEMHGFEVHDVETWRQHYAKTTEIWCERLYHCQSQAHKLASEEITRIWLAYLAGVSLSFERGSLRIYQTLVSKQVRGHTDLPPTRSDLYQAK